METFLQGIQNVVVYIDDISVTGNTKKVHFNMLNDPPSSGKSKFMFRESKHHFLLLSVVFYRIDAQGLHPLPEKVKVSKYAPKLEMSLSSTLTWGYRVILQVSAKLVHNFGTLV